MSKYEKVVGFDGVRSYKLDDGSTSYQISYRADGKPFNPVVANSNGRAVSVTLLSWLKKQAKNRNRFREGKPIEITVEDVFAYKQYIMANPDAQPHRAKEAKKAEEKKRHEFLTFNALFHAYLDDKIYQLKSVPHDFDERMEFIKNTFEFGKPPGLKAAVEDIKMWRRYGADRIFGELTPDRATKDIWDEYFAGVGDDLSPVTRNRALEIILRVYNHGRESQKKRTPEIEFKPTKATKGGKNERVFLDVDSRERIISYLEEKLKTHTEDWKAYMTCLLSLYTGMRKSELMEMKIENIKDLDSKDNFYIYIPLPKSKREGGEDVEPTVMRKEIQELLELSLEYHKQDSIESPFLFAGNDMWRKLTQSALRKKWNRIFAETGTPKGFTFHGFRHTYAVVMLEEYEKSLYVVSGLMRHSNYKTTFDNYKHHQKKKNGLPMHSFRKVKKVGDVIEFPNVRG